MILLAWMGCFGGDDGGDDSGSQATSEGGVDQTQDCVDYLGCLEAAGSDDLDLETQVYGPDGECWNSASEALACTQLCEAGLASQVALEPTLIECWGAAPTPSSVLFAEIGTDWVIEEWDDPSCDFLQDLRVELDGNDDASFEVLLSVYSIDFPSQCELNADRTFTCPSSDLGLVGGSFSPNFNTLNLDFDYEDQYVAYSCTAKAR